MRGSVVKGKSVSLYDGRNFLGRIEQQRDGAFIAFDAHGKELGSYPTQGEASRAVSQALIKALEAEIAWREHRK